MSIHIGAKAGEIAPTVLFPGDPLRAKYIAETFLENPVLYNQVRGMLGYTGTYRGKPVSVQGSGMGIPSLSIYATELIREYGVQNLIRVGSCGSLRADIKVRDIIIALSASTDSGVNRLRFGGKDYAPTASFELLMKAWAAAKAQQIPVQVGPIFASDTFYQEDPQWFKIWADHGVLAVEMETSGLYTLAAAHGVQALTICTVSDSLVSSEAVSAQEREQTFGHMVEIALGTL